MATKILVTTIELEREKALYVYRQARERGDFEAMARIHKQAETDPALEKALDEMEKDE